MVWHQHRVLQERWGRMFGLLTFGFFLVRQFLPESMGGMYPGFADAVVFTRWFLVTFMFVLFFHAYVKRTPALALANRPVEILLPLICAPLPIIMIVLCQLYYQQGWVFGVIHNLGVQGLFNPWFDISYTSIRWGLMIMAVGEVITIAGMWHLRSSFSIFTEARALVRSGLYRYVRHPLYLGEMVSVWGYAVVVPNTLTLISASTFSLLQIWRAKLEETKLLQAHPEYAKLQQTTGFLLPKLGKQQG